MKVSGRNLQTWRTRLDLSWIFKKISIYKYAYLSDKVDGLRIHSAKGFDKFLQI